jgi:sec-independent protein translocase protein TatB
MFDLGTQELIVIFIVAFLVFGPKKLPELSRTLGKGIRELKAAMRGITESMDEAGSDLADEIKDVKNDLEDSIYKSIEENLEKENDGEKKEGATEASDEKGAETLEERSKGKKETDKDG